MAASTGSTGGGPDRRDMEIERLRRENQRVLQESINTNRHQSNILGQLQESSMRSMSHGVDLAGSLFGRATRGAATSLAYTGNAVRGLGNQVSHVGEGIGHATDAFASTSSTMDKTNQDLKQAIGHFSAIFLMAGGVVTAFAGVMGLAGLAIKQYHDRLNVAREVGGSTALSKDLQNMSINLLIDADQIKNMSDSMAASFGMSLTNNQKEVQRFALKNQLDEKVMGKEYAEEAKASMEELKGAFAASSPTELMDKVSSSTMVLAKTMGISNKMALEQIKAINKNTKELIGEDTKDVAEAVNGAFTEYSARLNAMGITSKEAQEKIRDDATSQLSDDKIANSMQSLSLLSQSNEKGGQLLRAELQSQGISMKEASDLMLKKATDQVLTPEETAKLAKVSMANVLAQQTEMASLTEKARDPSLSQEDKNKYNADLVALKNLQYSRSSATANATKGKTAAEISAKADVGSQNFGANKKSVDNAANFEKIAVGLGIKNLEEKDKFISDLQSNPGDAAKLGFNQGEYDKAMMANMKSSLMAKNIDITKMSESEIKDKFDKQADTQEKRTLKDSAFMASLDTEKLNKLTNDSRESGLSLGGITANSTEFKDRTSEENMRSNQLTANQTGPENVANAIEKFGRVTLAKLENSIMELVNKAVGPLTTYINKLTGKMEGIGAFYDHWIKPIFTGIGQIYDVTLKPAVDKFAAWFGSAGTTQFGESLEKFRGFVGETFDNYILPAAKTAGKFFNETLLPMLGDGFSWFANDLVPKIKPTLEKFGNWLSNDLMPAIRPPLEKFGNWLSNDLAPQIKPAFEKIGEVVGKAATIAMPIISAIFKDLADTMQWVGPKIIPAFKAMYDWADKHVFPLINKLIGFGKKVWDFFSSMFNGGQEGDEENQSVGITLLSAAFKTIEVAGTALGKILDTVTENFEFLSKAVLAIGAVMLANAAIKKGRQVVNAVSEGVDRFKERGANAAYNVGRAARVARDLPGNIASAPGRAVRGVRDSFSGAFHGENSFSSLVSNGYNGGTRPNLNNNQQSQHTGPTQQHTGPTQQHTGPTQQHTGPTQQHTGPHASFAGARGGSRRPAVGNLLSGLNLGGILGAATAISEFSGTVEEGTTSISDGLDLVSGLRELVPSQGGHQAPQIQSLAPITDQHISEPQVRPTRTSALSGGAGSMAGTPQPPRSALSGGAGSMGSTQHTVSPGSTTQSSAGGKFKALLGNSGNKLLGKAAGLLGKFGKFAGPIGATLAAGASAASGWSSAGETFKDSDEMKKNNALLSTESDAGLKYAQSISATGKAIWDGKKYVDEFGKAIEAQPSTLQKLAGATGSMISDFSFGLLDAQSASEGAAKVFTWVSTSITDAWNLVSTFFSDMKPKFTEILSNIWGGVVNYFTESKNNLMKIFEGYLDVFTAPFKAFKAWFNGEMTFTEAMSTAWEGIKGGFSKVFEGVKDLMLQPFKALINFILKGVSKIPGFGDLAPVEETKEGEKPTDKKPAEKSWWTTPLWGDSKEDKEKKIAEEKQKAFEAEQAAREKEKEKDKKDKKKDKAKDAKEGDKQEEGLWDKIKSSAADALLGKEAKADETLDNGGKLASEITKQQIQSQTGLQSMATESSTYKVKPYIANPQSNASVITPLVDSKSATENAIDKRITDKESIERTGKTMDIMSLGVTQANDLVAKTLNSTTEEYDKTLKKTNEGFEKSLKDQNESVAKSVKDSTESTDKTLKGVKDTVDTSMGTVTNTVGSAMSSIMGTFSTVGSWLGNAANSMGQTISTSVESVKQQTTNAVDNAYIGAQKVFETVKGSLTGKPADNKKALLVEMAKEGITDPQEQAMLMAQVSTESGNFKYTKELGKDSYFDKYDAGTKKGAELGNTEKGDGAKYKGRGLIQLTGKANYAAASKDLGIDLVNHPELAESPEVAAKTAMWYWKKRKGLRESAQNGNVLKATKLINGGTNGLDDRQKYYTSYLADAQSGKLTADIKAASSTTQPSVLASAAQSAGNVAKGIGNAVIPAAQADEKLYNGGKLAPELSGNYYLGDSITEGYKKAAKGEGDTTVGANPKTILEKIKSQLAKDPNFFKGKNVNLSTGLSNNTEDTKSIEEQMKLLKAAGANASVYGVANEYKGDASKGAAMNKKLEELSAKYGMSFKGGFKASSDKVHPASYSNDKNADAAAKSSVAAGLKPEVLSQANNPVVNASQTPAANSTVSSTPAPGLQKVISAQTSGMVDNINQMLVNGVKDDMARGVKYQMGSRNSASGAIDCSGFVLEQMEGVKKAINDPSQIDEAMKAMKKGNTAAGITEQLAKLSGKELTGKDVNASNLKEGMTIGINNNDANNNDRYKGIDHIAQVVKDPTSGQLMVSHSGSKGPTMVPLDKFLKQNAGNDMTAVDPLYNVREKGALDAAQASVAGSNTPFSPVQQAVSSSMPTTSIAMGGNDVLSVLKEMLAVIKQSNGITGTVSTSSPTTTPVNYVPSTVPVDAAAVQNAAQTPAAQTPTTSPVDSTAVQNAAQTPAAAPQKDLIDAIKENTKKIESDGNYGAIEFGDPNLGEGMSFGAYQMTADSGNIENYLKELSKQGDQSADNMLKAITANGGSVDAMSLEEQKGLAEFLKVTATTDKGKAAQDKVFEDNYVKPAKDIAEKTGITDKAAIAQLVDQVNMMGVDGAQRIADAAKASGDLTAAGLAKARKEDSAKIEGHEAFVKGWNERTDKVTEAFKSFESPTNAVQNAAQTPASTTNPQGKDAVKVESQQQTLMTAKMDDEYKNALDAQEKLKAQIEEMKRDGNDSGVKTAEDAIEIHRKKAELLASRGAKIPQQTTPIDAAKQSADANNKEIQKAVKVHTIDDRYDELNGSGSEDRKKHLEAEGFNFDEIKNIVAKKAYGLAVSEDENAKYAKANESLKKFDAWQGDNTLKPNKDPLARAPATKKSVMDQNEIDALESAIKDQEGKGKDTSYLKSQLDAMKNLQEKHRSEEVADEEKNKKTVIDSVKQDATNKVAVPLVNADKTLTKDSKIITDGAGNAVDVSSGKPMFDANGKEITDKTEKAKAIIDKDIADREAAKKQYLEKGQTKPAEIMDSSIADLKKMKESIESGKTKIGDSISPENAKLSNVGSAISSSHSDSPLSSKTGFNGALNRIGSTFDGLFETISENFKLDDDDVLETIADSTKIDQDEVNSTIGDSMGNGSIADSFTSLFDSGSTDTSTNGGSDIFSSIGSGISNTVSSIGSGISDTVSSIGSSVGGFLGFAGGGMTPSSPDPMLEKLTGMVGAAGIVHTNEFVVPADMVGSMSNALSSMPLTSGSIPSAAQNIPFGGTINPPVIGTATSSQQPSNQNAKTQQTNPNAGVESLLQQILAENRKQSSSLGVQARESSAQTRQASKSYKMTIDRVDSNRQQDVSNKTDSIGVF